MITYLHIIITSNQNKNITTVQILKKIQTQLPNNGIDNETNVFIREISYAFENNNEQDIKINVTNT